MSEQQMPSADYVTKCPACNTKLRILSHLLGTRLQCSRCGHTFMVAAAITLADPPPVPESKPAITIQAWKPKPIRRRPVVTFSAIRNFVLLGITILSAAVVYRQFAAGNLDVGRLLALLEKHNDQQQAVADPEPRTTQRRSQTDQVARPLPSRGVTNHWGEPHRRTESIPPAASDRNERRTLAPLLEEKPPTPTDITLAKIPLEVSSGRQMSELPDDYDRPSIKLSIAGFPASARVLPGEGVLADGAKVEIWPFGDKSVYLVAQIVEPTGESPRLMIEAKTSLDWIGGDRLTEDRLKRKRVAMVKRANVAAAHRTAVVSEIASLVAFVQSHGVKPLQDVGDAKNRIAALQRTLPNLDAQVVAAQQQVVQFDQFCKRLEMGLKDAAIVLGVDPPPVAAEQVIQVAGYQDQ